LEGVYQEKNITSATTIGGVQALYDSFTVSADGKYKAGFDLSIANPGFLTSESRFVQFQLRKNGVLASTDAVATCQLLNHPAAGQDYASTGCSTILDFVAGDTIEIWASAANAGVVSVHSGNLYIVPVGQGDQLVGNATNDFAPVAEETNIVSLTVSQSTLDAVPVFQSGSCIKSGPIVNCNIILSMDTNGGTPFSCTFPVSELPYAPLSNTAFGQGYRIGSGSGANGGLVNLSSDNLSMIIEGTSNTTNAGSWAWNFTYRATP